jgi:hypothetical protein
MQDGPESSRALPGRGLVGEIEKPALGVKVACRQRAVARPQAPENVALLRAFDQEGNIGAGL